MRQLLFRPTRSLYRTPRHNLHLCGASNPPEEVSMEWPAIMPLRRRSRIRLVNVAFF
jgi:hypothetical protein